MDPGVRVREATPTDLARIVAFNQAMARETEGRELDPERLTAGVRTLLEDPSRGRYFIAESVAASGPVRLEAAEAAPDPTGAATAAGADRARAHGPAPVGQAMVTFEWSDWRNGPIWWIQSVFVTPAWRRRGVYRALHALVRRRAREVGAVGLRLYVDRDNAPARATYRALGMRPSRYDMFEEIWS